MPKLRYKIEVRRGGNFPWYDLYKVGWLSNTYLGTFIALTLAEAEMNKLIKKETKDEIIRTIEYNEEGKEINKLTGGAMDAKQISY